MRDFLLLKKDVFNVDDDGYATVIEVPKTELTKLNQRRVGMGSGYGRSQKKLPNRQATIPEVITLD